MRCSGSFVCKPSLGQSLVHHRKSCWLAGRSLPYVARAAARAQCSGRKIIEVVIGIAKLGTLGGREALSFGEEAREMRTGSQVSCPWPMPMGNPTTGKAMHAVDGELRLSRQQPFTRKYGRGPAMIAIHRRTDNRGGLRQRLFRETRWGARAARSRPCAAMCLPCLALPCLAFRSTGASYPQRRNRLPPSQCLVSSKDQVSECDGLTDEYSSSEVTVPTLQRGEHLIKNHG